MLKRDPQIVIMREHLKKTSSSLNQALMSLRSNLGSSNVLKETIGFAIGTIDSCIVLKDDLIFLDISRNPSTTIEHCSSIVNKAIIKLDKAMTDEIDGMNWRYSFVGEVIEARKDLHELYKIFDRLDKNETEKQLRSLATTVKTVLYDKRVSRLVELSSLEEIMSFINKYSPDKKVISVPKKVIGESSASADVKDASSASADVKDASSASAAVKDASSASAAVEDASTSADS